LILKVFMLLDDKQKEVALVNSVISACLLISKQLKLYGSANRQVDLATSRLQGFLESYFLYHETLHMTVARHGFIYDEDFVNRQNKAFVGFAYTLFQHGISAITLQQDVSPADIQEFLFLTGRPPADTWEEGGIVAALHIRGIDRISVREMSENDIAYLDELDETDRDLLLKEKSPLWDRFAFAVYRGLTKSDAADAGNADVNPTSLAELTNQILNNMPASSQQQFSKGLSSFLASIQFEKINRYRNRALAKLSEFINRISPEIRARLFSHIFNLKMKPAFTEEFFSGLSDEIIIELLEATAKESDYVPPLIMKVLGKIAQEKKLKVQHIGEIDQELAKKKNEIARLFKKDDFEKYVPDRYRDALLNIIRFDTVPKQVDENLLVLKGSLEEQQQEKHTADIILKILNESCDENYLKGLGENLVSIVDLYLEEGSYRELNDLCALLERQGSHADHFEKFRQTLASSGFTEAVIRGVGRHGKRCFNDIEALVNTVGTPFVEPLLTALTTDANRANRSFYLKLLQQLDAGEVIPLAVRYLDDPRWFIVRNIIHILRNIQDPQVVPFIRPLMEHPHHKIRHEAIRTCLYYGCDDATSRLIEMLDAKDNQTVDIAISMAMMVKDANVAGRLIALLKSNPVINYRGAQKKAIVKTLAETIPKGALPVFFEILSKKNTLHPNQHRELIAEILSTFERYDPKLLIPAIAEHAASVNTDIRDRLKSLQSRMES
jgi:hypothetical protein